MRHRKWVNNDAKNFSFRSYENLEHCARLDNNNLAGFLSSSHFVVYAIHFANWECSVSLLWSSHSSADFLFNLRLFRGKSWSLFSAFGGISSDVSLHREQLREWDSAKPADRTIERRLVKETVLEPCIDPTSTSRRACDAKKLFIKSTESARWRISLSTIPVASNAKHAGRSWRLRATSTTNRIKTIKKWVNWRFLMRFNQPIADYKQRFEINWMFD